MAYALTPTMSVNCGRFNRYFRHYTKPFRFTLLIVLLSSLTSAYVPGYHDRPWGPPILPPQVPLADTPSLAGVYEFSLRHIFHRGTYERPSLHKRLDIKPHTRLHTVSDEGVDQGPASFDKPLIVHSNPVTIQRLADRRVPVVEGYLATARSIGSTATLSPPAWVMDTLEGPNITDKQSILTFAQMTANDYIEEPGTEDWQDVHGPLNYSSSFGWRGDGLRGHIYADKSNTTIVISLKGTSPALFDGAGTTTNDKINDNLYFSCCCGQGVSYLSRQVCDCQKSAYVANSTCIIEAMNDENRYYRASIDLYSNVTELYPNANVWLTGHSLGGAMTSLLGLTFGLPVVTFEAVPEALPAARLGLPSPPGYDERLPQSRQFTGAFHFGHTADPVYMGTCNGVGSICTWGGYAMESACHTGQMCVYDTVEDKGWRVAIGTHRIKSVIPDVIEAYDEVPACEREEECFDCVLWKFFQSNGSEITTTSTSKTMTSTSTCKTPGWWGCLDETATTTATAPVTTTSKATTSTSTCKTPGWWGCLDETATTTARTPVTTTSKAVTSTSTCKTPGWWGCLDETTTGTQSSVATSTLKPTCKSPGWFGCKDPTSGTTSIMPPLTAVTSCTHPGWFGCLDPISTPTRTCCEPTTSTLACETPGLFWGCRDSSTSKEPPVTPRPTVSSPSATTSASLSTCTTSVFFGLICFDL